MVYIIGLDIGGANIKAVKLKPLNKVLEVKDVVREYFPLWIHGKKGLERKLYELRSRLVDEPRNYFVSVCMTAELCDIYRVKREGVEHVVNTVCNVFRDSLGIRFVTVDMRLVDKDEAIRNYLKVAAANWAATAWFLERYCTMWGLPNSILIDIGSTTTSIIPLINGKVHVRGFTDPDKLLHGELVYTGVLRGNVATITDRVPYKGFLVRISFEKFALTGDVHLVLGYIKSEDYTTETANGRRASLKEAIERLARIICADVEMMNPLEVREIARYIYESQVFKVFEALMQIRSRIASLGLDPDKFTVITAGIGEYLAREAAKRAGFKDIMSISELVGSDISSVLPAYATALMMVHEVLRHD